MIVSSNGSSSVQLDGVFSAALRQEARAFRSPRAVVNSQGVSAPSMIVKFSGSVGNSGNLAVTVTLKMRATSSGAALKTGEATSQTVTVNPLELKPVTISQTVDQTDVPGNVSADAWLVDGAGVAIAGASKSSGVIGTIQPVATPTLTGIFTLG